MPIQITAVGGNAVQHCELSIDKREGISYVGKAF